MQEFHIHKTLRDKYQIDQSLFEFDGNVVFANIQAVRKFVQKINTTLDPITAAEKNISTSQIYALGLIDEILHFVFAQYRKQVYPNALEDGYISICKNLGTEKVHQTFILFCQEFPPTAVYRKEISLETYLSTHENQLSTLEEMILLHLANTNPAFMQYGDFFDDSLLTSNSIYPQLMHDLEVLFATKPGFGPDNQDIMTMLHTPAVISPHSLEGQLQFIRGRWSSLVQNFLLRILGSEDLIKEETKAIFGGPGPVHIPDYESLRKLVDLEVERFSPDSDWMPRLVLMAKNSYVWLFQLSLKYQRQITHLDQIPDAELDALTEAGVTGLWLIGLWERSKASETIKKMCGNPEAVASAYSIMNYEIAQDLGGHDALENLKGRAWQRGIRLASDMVPNHMGIDSSWVIDHPEFFVSLPDSPYPAYSFNGQNLSPTDRVGLYLEDHYFDRSDAAVVFKRVDHQNGGVQYIYHGNDGTTMPWNDTAQLNYLSAQVREEVIQLILRVARDFPVIRFDAAMTLAKKHYQRLWFPEPGHGGAIPSRSEHAITSEEFHRVFPEEFWREVVDRVAREVPDTLLLAEAFWLMESYFVRTLGMHRVYNSAFMNMLRNEENAKYRALMKNTLEFDPEILKRFVNFMNNPDERTAVDQFGKGDKYFGVCTLMVTLPGLPMLGHGQIEGYSEKYGMEYRRAYLDEYPDGDLVARHKWQIFPLTHQRYLFSGVDNFYLYDFFRENGSVDEDVYAYSNGFGNQRALIVFHNKYASTQGWIKSSSSRLNKGTNQLQQSNLGVGLGLHNSDHHYVIFHDQVTGQEVLHRCSEIFQKGQFFHLDAYTCRVFNHIHEVEDLDGSWAELYGEIGGQYTWDIFHQMKMHKYRRLHQAASGLFRSLLLPELTTSGESTDSTAKVLDQKIIAKLNDFLSALCDQGGINHTNLPVASEFCSHLLRAELDQENDQPIAAFFASKNYQSWLKDRKSTPQIKHFESLSLVWCVLSSIYKLADKVQPSQSGIWFEEFALAEPLKESLHAAGLSDPEINQAVTFIYAELTCPELNLDLSQSQEKYLHQLFSHETMARLLGENQSGGVLWYQKEALELWLEWKSFIAPLQSVSYDFLTWSQKLEIWLNSAKNLQIIQAAIEESKYQVDLLIQNAVPKSETDKLKSK